MNRPEDIKRAWCPGIASWCNFLNALLEDETLTDHERAEIEGVKKAMEGMGFKNQGPEVKGAINKEIRHGDV